MTEEEIENCPTGALVEVPRAGYPSELIILYSVLPKMHGLLITGWVVQYDTVRHTMRNGIYIVHSFMYERMRRLA